MDVLSRSDAPPCGYLVSFSFCVVLIFPPCTQPKPFCLLRSHNISVSLLIVIVVILVACASSGRTDPEQPHISGTQVTTADATADEEDTPESLRFAEILPPTYSWIYSFSDGLARVRTGNPDTWRAFEFPDDAPLYGGVAKFTPGCTLGLCRRNRK